MRLVPSDPPTPFLARLAALHARTALGMGREVEAQRWAREAIDIATAIGKPAASADAATTLAVLLRRAHEPALVAERLFTIAEDARASGEAAVELRTRFNIGSLYYELGDLAIAQEAYDQAMTRAREHGRPWAAYGMEARAMVGLIQYLRGDWDAAVHTLDVTGETATAQAEAVYLAITMMVRSGRGDAAALDLFPVLRPWWDRDGLVALYSTAAAVDLYAHLDRPNEALAMIDEVVTALATIWQDEWFLARIRLAALGVATLAGAAMTQPESARAALVARGDVLVGGGRASAEQGLPEGRKLGVEGSAWVARLEAEWLRLRWLAGHDVPSEQELIDAWQAAVDGFSYGHVFELARSRARLAAVLRAAGRGREAAVQADLARDVARTLGAEPLLAEIRALGTTRAASREAGGSQVLTSRERDVLALLIEGRTNRQIANQLYISEKTVSVHVSNILAKLEVGSRTEAAALARREGLLA
jgi:DNA-binding NarL/FixJ family response regulator